MGTGLHEPDAALNDLATNVIGAAIEVHRALGPGFLESTYERALAIELTIRGLPYVAQHPVALEYKGHLIGEGRLDILVDRRFVVELKAVDGILGVHRAQVISYLKATDQTLGLLINFNVEVLKYGVERIIYSRKSSQA